MGNRGFRIDVEVKTTSGEIALVEVQLRVFPEAVERALLYTEQALASSARRGDRLEKTISELPRVIVVNIMDFELRAQNQSFHQIAELAYREAPYERASDRLEIHNLFCMRCTHPDGAHLDNFKWSAAPYLIAS